VDVQRAILTGMFSRITLGTEGITFLVDVPGVIGLMNGRDVIASPPDDDNDLSEHIVALKLPVIIKRRGNEVRLVLHSGHAPRTPDGSLVSLVAKAHLYLNQLTSIPGATVADVAGTFGVHRADVGRLLPLAFAAPKLLDQVLNGTQPSELSARILTRAELPHLWEEQEAAFG
jgi:hypothetical protein